MREQLSAWMPRGSRRAHIPPSSRIRAYDQRVRWASAHIRSPHPAGAPGASPSRRRPCGSLPDAGCQDAECPHCMQSMRQYTWPGPCARPSCLGPINLPPINSHRWVTLTDVPEAVGTPLARPVDPPIRSQYLPRALRSLLAVEPVHQLRDEHLDALVLVLGVGVEGDTLLPQLLNILLI